jgi:hypothetical protein
MMDWLSDPWVLLIIGAAVPLHPLEQIINVHWDEGLAVIFGKEDTDAPPFEES